ncbi:molybdopterin molybdotransferase MoeA [Tsukamurella paurometabola]|uniref:Molybdopterin molybdenumtransferase n=1 Tax=Tsukamurella paurometabola (strain ATCC 8368 / DSM 20162 / CCUG 35730 / CIP 100753 / JCM 10117 / KCTC 9821 / NBRC 16120 / NCIMB 702349 / NCTC 13040) TaxID=521096 RepID=D5UQI3_TSUPD|nr:gephyrin-like molybdotransferase Glp [Tsukamurella paurometabola]ADG78953.1 molybdenum cofactor synthesis domain protein [Tsukamurella paurometabola DSM 20162]SUP33606.1 Molybdopterin molybdenumtransferase [Tsukamurella paurometabola]
MITVDQHRNRILAAALPLPPVDTALAEADGLVLAQDVVGRWPVPLFDNSAMDGYAVRAADAAVGARLRVVADVPAGGSADPRFGPGEAVRIMTGAPVPTDADAIVPLEATDLGVTPGAAAPGAIVVRAAPLAGAHVRRRGEDAPAGAVTVATGAVLGPWQLSAIASSGHERVLAHPRPRVAVIATGSELVAPSGVPARGQIPDSNSFLLVAALRDAGAEVVTVRTVADDAAALTATLAEVRADAVVLTGGASVGAFDVVRSVLGASGGVRFESVAVQPGKPQGFGTAPDGTLLFCLPGNPVAVAVSFEMFVRPAVRALAGHREVQRPTVIRRAAAGWHSPAQRDQVLPVVVGPETVRPAPGGSGSHLVASLASANGLALVPAGVDRVAEGDPVAVLVL